MDDIKIAKEWR